MASKALTFKLSEDFISRVASWADPFEGNPLGKFVYDRTYSRYKDDDSLETWTDTCRRVVEGCYTLQKEHIEEMCTPWNDEQAQRSAEEMFERMYTMKFLPPGRGIWVMGTDIIHKKGLGMAANNCAYVTTRDLDKDPIKPFSFLMDASMAGTGVGADTEGKNKVRIFLPVITPNQAGLTHHTVEDTREGWVRSLEVLLYSYFNEDEPDVVFDYSEIRAPGLRLKTFGGLSSGYEPLKELHDRITKVLHRDYEKNNKLLSATGIADIFNLIGKTVVAGNIRRTAIILFGDKDDEEFLDLKNYEKNPQRADYSWTSNNSIFADLGMNYKNAQDRMIANGEPGICLLDNMRKFGRMVDPPNWKDIKAGGGNPCLEQTLESFEVCCLVETFPTKHKSLEDYKRTLKFAYMYAKTVTLLKTNWKETNAVVMRNRRIGCSMSGVAQFLGNHTWEEFRTWLDESYQTIQDWDKIYSDWFCIPRSIKTTSIKPSGTVSLLAGVTPGMHFPESKYYIRRVRLANNSHLIPNLKAQGFHIEPCVGCEDTTSVCEFPVYIGEVKTIDDVTMWEQLELAAFLQHWYADNQVSCTVTFDPKTEGKHIAAALNTYQYRLKGISFLPRFESSTAYQQMPYEKITKEKYEELVAKQKGIIQQPPAKRQRTQEELMPDAVMYCDGDKCML